MEPPINLYTQIWKGKEKKSCIGLVGAMSSVQAGVKEGAAIKRTISLYILYVCIFFGVLGGWV